MPKCGMVVEEWLAEDFPLKIDQSTNTTKFTIQVYISKYLFLTCRGWFGV
jgi:hypothetical protein